MDNETTSSLSARRELASLIKDARTKRDLSQAQLGALIGCSQSKIQKIEAATQFVEAQEVTAIVDRLALDQQIADRMLLLANHSATRALWTDERTVVPRYVRRYLELERVASEILSWHGRIPGPLQSPRYMAGLAAAGSIELAVFVRNQSRRREIFHGPALHRYVCLLAEETLRRVAGALGRHAALDQLDHLIGIGESAEYRGRATVRIVPIGARVVYLPNDFSILRFADGADPVVYVEHVAGGRCLQSAAELTKANQVWATIAACALDPADTVDFLRQLRAEIGMPTQRRSMFRT
jgi:transcriptional regulator with XRE-family HTH domain